MSNSVEKFITTKIDENKDKYDIARKLVLSKNCNNISSKMLNIETFASKLDLIPTYLQYHVQQVDPNYFKWDTMVTTQTEFVNKRFPVVSESDRRVAGRMVEKYQSQGLAFIEDDTTVACVYCWSYMCWSRETNIARHFDSLRHRNNRLGIFGMCM